MTKYFFNTFLIVIYSVSAFGNQNITSFGFIENKGQISHREIHQLRPDVKFKLESNGINSYFKANGIENYVYKQQETPIEKWPEAFKKSHEKDERKIKLYDTYYFRFDINFLNANKNVIIEPYFEKEIKRNYYYEYCPDGIIGVKEYQKIVYKNIYQNIDLQYYTKDGFLKYDFILHKGANINDIEIELAGVKNLLVTKEGKLSYQVDDKLLEEDVPFSFMSSTGKEIKISYQVTENIVSFTGYNGTINEDIIIDPVLEWSTFFPGVYGGYQGDPCVDAQGNIYVSTTDYGTSNTFPVLNAGSGQWYQSTNAGPAPAVDIVMFKFNSAYALQWATYYGGQEYEAAMPKRNVTIDETTNSIYIVATTEHVYSNGIQDLPTMNPGGGAFYQDAPTYGNKCPFFVKLSTSGVRQWATLFNYELGLPSAASMGIGISSIYFRNGKLYFAGTTNKYSTSGIPLRTLAGGYNNSFFVGNNTPFVGRFSSSCVLEWCSYINANVSSANFFGNVADMVVDANDNIYVATNYTEYSPTPLNTIMPLVNLAGAYFQNTTTLSGGTRRGIHITKLHPSSSSVLWGTFFNGMTSSGSAPGYSEIVDIVNGIDLDANNNLYLVGRIGTSDFPVQNPGAGAYYQATKRSAAGYTDGLVSKFSSSGVKLWATYINGTTPTSNTNYNPYLTEMVDIDCYQNGDIMMSGNTITTDFPLVSVVGSFNKSTLTTSTVAENVFTKFNSSGAIIWGSYFHKVGLSAYGAIQNSACQQKYIVSSSAESGMPTVNPGSGAYYNTSFTNGYFQGFQSFVDLPTTTTPTITANPTTITSGASATLTATGGTTYTWSTGVNTTSIVVTPTITTTYTVITGTGACTVSATQLITVNTTTCTPPTVVFNSSVDSERMCFGNTVTLPTGFGASTYTVSPGPIVGPTFTVSPANTTTYSLVGTNASGCVSVNTATYIVFVDYPSTAPISITATSTLLCSGSSTLSVNGGSLGTGANWKWYSGSCGGTTVGTGTSIVVSPVANTTYYVRAEGICGNTACASISVNTATPSTAPTAINPSPATICAGATSTLSILLSGGGSLGTGATWQWYSGSCGGTSVGSGNFVYVSPTVTTVYFVRAQGICNNTACADVTITVLPTSSSSATSIAVTNPVACSVNATTLAVSGGSLASGAAWAWYNTSCGGGTSIATGSIITVNPTITTTYYVRAESSCGNTSCIQVTVTPTASTPTITAASISSNTICSGSTATIIPTGASTYTLLPGGTSGTSFTVNPTSTTIYTISGTNAGGCTSTASTNLTTTITVSGTPTISLQSISSNTICSGTTVTITPSGASSYTLVPGNSVGTTFTVSPLSTTVYTISGSFGTNCVSTSSNNLTTTITVSSAVTPTITTSSTTLSCGSSATLTATGATTYTWNTGATTSTIAVNPTSTSTYTVLTGTGTCTNIAVQTITVNPLPTPTITASSSTVSCGSSTTLTANGSTTYTWNTGATTSSIIVTPTSTSIYTVSTGSGACTSNSTISVTYIPSTVTLAISPDVAITAGSQTQLNVTSNNTTYTWSPSTNLSCTTCTNPIASPVVTTTYCAFTSIGSCTTQACVVVTVKESCDSNKEYGVPNAFSPNGDGNNDEFCLQGWKGCVTGFLIKIYDRWGEKVYESTDETFCWDGIYQGKLLDPAVFVYYIQATIENTGPIAKKGNITLIK